MFTYPNEGVIEWDLLIFIYPYITGLVAGAFIVSSLYHVFGLSKLRPFARFSLLAALAFLLVAPIPLTLHLGRPERAFEMFLRPNLSSAMSGFGYIWFFYLLLLLVEVWLVFRQDIVRYAITAHGIKRAVYSVLALGVYEIPPKAAAVDKKLIKALALFGIPVASLLHGYVGFIFGAVKANPWWSSPLMPVIFLMSAIVSGTALLIVLYILVARIRRAPVEHESIHYLAGWLFGFLFVAMVLEGLELFAMFYEQSESWQAISRLIGEQLYVSYVLVQIMFGSVLPLIVLAGVQAFKLERTIKTAIIFVAAGLVMTGVLAMRWNVVIGGQELSKSLRGFIDYMPPLLGLNGIVTAATIMAVPFVICAVLLYLLPPWPQEVKAPQRPALGFRPSGLKF